MKFFLLVVAFLFLSAVSSWGADGLIALKSPYKAKETMDRLESVVQSRGLTVFVRIDHAQGAEEIGESLPPTEVILFGNPKGGTPFMQCVQTVGIDLPLKALVWEDENGQTWLGYNDPIYLARRHGATDCPVVVKLSEVLSGIAGSVVAQ